jgi:hypothetical protein
MVDSMAGSERSGDFLPLVGVTGRQEDRPMFTVHCPTHGGDVLLTERRIDALESSPAGHRLRWRCWCGTAGTTFVGRTRGPGMVGRHRPVA